MRSFRSISIRGSDRYAGGHDFLRASLDLPEPFCHDAEAQSRKHGIEPGNELRRTTGKIARLQQLSDMLRR
jgi:hypothetical protein